MNEQKIVVFVPVYNCEKQIGRVIDQLEQQWVIETISRVIIVDNQSTDRTAQVVIEKIQRRGDGFIEFLQNQDNYGLGGSHKVAFDYAAENGFDYLVVLHGDDQGSIIDFKSVIARAGSDRADAILGSRFMRGSSVSGYSRVRLFGNIVFNTVYSFVLGRVIYDLGSGLNMYRVESLKREEYIRYPDDLTFNCVLLCAQIINQKKITFWPITWREEDQVSNVKLVRQSMKTLQIVFCALIHRGAFPSAEYRQKIHDVYRWETIKNG